MSIWEIVKDLEENKSKEKDELLYARSTMLVNFSKKNGRLHKLINNKMSMTEMVFEVFTYYEKKLHGYKKSLEKIANKP